jgi:hypothetical protein
MNKELTYGTLSASSSNISQFLSKYDGIGGVHLTSKWVLHPTTFPIS